MRRLLLLAVLLLLSGCSAIKIAYNHADHAGAWMADDYFDLDGQQKEALRACLERFHAWHRATQLGDYARLLETAQTRLGSGVAPEDAAWVVDSYKARYRVLVLRGYADAARLLSTLSDEQVAGARQAFEKSNRKFAQEHAADGPADEQRRLRGKRQLERFEHWAGALTPAHTARFLELSRALPLVTHLRLQDRSRRQREFLALLEARRELDAFPTALRDWLLDWNRNRPPEHAAELSRFTDALGRMYVETIGQLTPEQRNHVASRMQRYAQALRELAEQTPRVTDLATRP